VNENIQEKFNNVLSHFEQGAASMDQGTLFIKESNSLMREAIAEFGSFASEITSNVTAIEKDVTVMKSDIAGFKSAEVTTEQHRAIREAAKQRINNVFPKDDDRKYRLSARFKLYRDGKEEGVFGDSIEETPVEKLQDAYNFIATWRCNTSELRNAGQGKKKNHKAKQKARYSGEDNRIIQMSLPAQMPQQYRTNGLVN